MQKHLTFGRFHLTHNDARRIFILLLKIFGATNRIEQTSASQCSGHLMREVPLTTTDPVIKLYLRVYHL